MEGVVSERDPDKPYHVAKLSKGRSGGKLPGIANSFYRQQVDQHLHIGVKAMELLRATGPETLHSRKLRGFSETAFQ